MKPIEKFNNIGSELTFKFESKEAALNFKEWLCESGEQHYWNWMEECEKYGDEKGNITALSFNYHTGDSTITTECGRLSDEEGD